MTTERKPLDLDLIKRRREIALAKADSAERNPFGRALVQALAEAASRSSADVPELVEEVEQLREQLGSMQDSINAAVQAKESVVTDRNYAMRQRDDERAAKEGNIAALNAAIARAETAEASGTEEASCVHCGQVRARHGEQTMAFLRSGYYANRFDPGPTPVPVDDLKDGQA